MIKLSDKSFTAMSTHFNAKGEAHMVDIKNKAATHRQARASGTISMRADTLKMLADGSSRKGDVLGVARIAAIQAAKQTAQLIPLCHALALSHIEVDCVVAANSNSVCCTVIAETIAGTGVEMEALTAVTVGLLTIYDMCKAMDRGMVIQAVRLLEKSGGKSGHWLADS